MSKRDCYFAMGVIEGGAGWGGAPFRGDKAHYFVRVDIPLDFSAEHPDLTGMFDSLCGMQVFATDRVPLLNPGNFPHCKTCERSLAKKAP